jgi:hypothetical protein
MTMARQRDPGGERDRRDPGRQRPIRGGTRASDPPLTTRECGDWMGMSPKWVRDAIVYGHHVKGAIVFLEAESVVVNRRTVHRIYLDRFAEFLTAIGWSRIPRLPRADDDAA